ncbi:hypothetical protein V5O48_017662, partial [Marasmius crinis-equi]
MTTENDHSKICVIPSAHAESTLLHGEAESLRDRIRFLERVHSELHKKIERLDGSTKRIEHDNSTLRDRLERSEAEVEKLDDNCDFLLKNWKRYVEAYRRMRAAKERVLYLRRKIETGEAEDVIEELMSTSGSPEGPICQAEGVSGEGVSCMKRGTEDFFGGALPLAAAFADEVKQYEEDPMATSEDFSDPGDAESEHARGLENEENVESLELVPFPVREPVPEWFSSLFPHLNLRLGSGYLRLVNHWVTIERLKGWGSPPKGLSARLRPQQLGQVLLKQKTQWDWGPQTGEDFMITFPKT